jgi:HD domain
MNRCTLKLRGDDDESNRSEMLRFLNTLPLWPFTRFIAIGSGYPSGLTGEAIPVSARIVVLADVFDALTMKRRYKEAWSIEDAAAEIRRGAGAYFDPALVDVFTGISPKIIGILNEWADKEACM